MNDDDDDDAWLWFDVGLVLLIIVGGALLVEAILWV